MGHVVQGFECETCQGFVVRQELVNADGGGFVCPKDGGKVHPAEFCEKTGYECTSCKTTSRKPDKCKKCGNDMEKVTNRANVVWRCSKCKNKFDERGTGKCPDCRKDLKKFCSKSGTWPHGTDASNCK